MREAAIRRLGADPATLQMSRAFTNRVIMIKAALACGAVAFAAMLAACRVQEPPVPPTSDVLRRPLSELDRNDRPVCADRYHRRRLDALARRPPASSPSWWKRRR